MEPCPLTAIMHCCYCTHTRFDYLCLKYCIFNLELLIYFLLHYKFAVYLQIVCKTPLVLSRHLYLWIVHVSVLLSKMMWTQSVYVLYMEFGHQHKCLIICTTNRWCYIIDVRIFTDMVPETFLLIVLLHF